MPFHHLSFPGVFLNFMFLDFFRTKKPEVKDLTIDDEIVLAEEEVTKTNQALTDLYDELKEMQSKYNVVLEGPLGVPAFVVHSEMPSFQAKVMLDTWLSSWKVRLTIAQQNFNNSCRRFGALKFARVSSLHELKDKAFRSVTN